MTDYISYEAEGRYCGELDVFNPDTILVNCDNCGTRDYAGNMAAQFDGEYLCIRCDYDNQQAWLDQRQTAMRG